MRLSKRLDRKRGMPTDRERIATEDTVPTVFNFSNSAIMKIPKFPGPTTAKERRTISSFVRERGNLEG
jgi:hypothetical protein